MTKPTASGLDGVNVADTLISHVDGERGRLVIAGSDVEQLAATATFEDAATRVLAAGAGRELPAVTFGPARVAAWELVPRLGDALDLADGMDALRTALGHVASTGDDLADALAALGAAPVFVAAWSRRRAGDAAIAPDPALSHAADYLRMTVGATPSPAAVAALDAYLVTVIDHGMSASTFTARVIASTASDLLSAIVGAVGALKGPLHGGAPGPVLDMLDAIGAPDAARAEVWLRAELAAGRRIMGMGHRIYRVRDPRAAVLEKATQTLEAAIGASAGRLALARAVENAASAILREKRPDRPLCANVEFFTAVLLDAIGLERALFTPTFAVARVAGWLAHVAEHARAGRLIRPASRYVGPLAPAGDSV